MKITAHVVHFAGRHEVQVATAGRAQQLSVPPKPAGGSAVNGGEFLMLALATCYCNDLYREAERLGLVLDGVEVEASAHFNGVGLAAEQVSYRARVRSNEPAERIAELLAQTDAVAEVHNTMRTAVPVQLLPWNANEA